ncbi:MAG: DUF3592 domain-containing protein [Pseudomonadota bacterium]
MRLLRRWWDGPNRILRLVFLVFGLGITWIGLSIAQTAWAARDWVQVEGTILAPEVVERFASADAGGTMWYVAIQYGYRFEGREWEGRLVRYGGGDQASKMFSSPDAAAQAAAREFAPGMAVTVYVDPDDPSRAVLDRSFGFVSLAALALGLTLIALAIGIGFSRPASPSNGKGA